MSYIAATAAFLQLGMNYMGAQAAKAAGQAEGKEYDAQALHTLLTAKWNIGNIQQSGFHQEIDLFDQAGEKRGLIARYGTQQLGKMKTALGASGVRMDSGTSADLIIKSRLDNATRLLQNQEALSQSLTNLRFKTQKTVEKTARTANERYAKLKRMGDIARQGGNAAQFAAMMGGLVSAGKTFHSLGGVDWLSSMGDDGVQTDANTGSTTGSSFNTTTGRSGGR